MFLLSTLPARLNALLALTFSGALLIGCGSSDSGDQIAQGKQAVTTRACTSCHKDNLAGDKEFYPGTMAHAANLTPDEATGLAADWTTDMIVNAILNGVDDEGEMLCTMPKFGAAPYNMTTDEAKAIAAYLRSIPAVSNDVGESMCAEKK